MRLPCARLLRCLRVPLVLNYRFVMRALLLLGLAALGLPQAAVDEAVETDAAPTTAAPTTAAPTTAALTGVAQPAAGPTKPEARLAATTAPPKPVPLAAVTESYKEPLPPVEERLKGAAARLAALSPADCRRRLAAADAAKVFVRQGPYSGIATPLRIDAPLGPVTFLVPPKKSPFGLLDCRQALLWIELEPVLGAHGITRLRIDNFYRQGAKLPHKRGHKSQHAYGLAADIVKLWFDGDGEGPEAPVEVDVERDFAGVRGEPPCGPEAELILPEGGDDKQRERALRLRNFVCELARDGWFHHILTPNYDAAHRNHLHLDIKRDNRWYSVN